MMHHDTHVSVIGEFQRKFHTILEKNIYYIAVTGLDMLTDINVMTLETFKYIDRVCCNSGKSLPICLCDNTAPAPSFDASVVRINSLEKSGYCQIGGDINFCFKVQNAIS
jgi:hypothetical protein